MESALIVGSAGTKPSTAVTWEDFGGAHSADASALRREPTKYAYEIKKHEAGVCLLGQVLEVRRCARVRVGLSDSSTLDLTEKPGRACVKPPNCARRARRTRPTRAVRAIHVYV